MKIVRYLSYFFLLVWFFALLGVGANANQIPPYLEDLEPIPGYSFGYFGHYGNYGSTTVPAFNALDGTAHLGAFSGAQALDFDGVGDYLAVSANGHDMATVNVSCIVSTTNENIFFGWDGASTYSDCQFGYAFTYNYEKLLAIAGSVDELEALLQHFQQDPWYSLRYDSDVVLLWIVDPTIKTVLAPKIYSEGPELVEDGDFSEGYMYWSVADDAGAPKSWVISGGKATKFSVAGGGGGGRLQQLSRWSSNLGDKYITRFTILDFIATDSQATIQKVGMGGVTGSGDGRRTRLITNTTGDTSTAYWSFYGNANCNQSVTDISLKQVPTNAVGDNNGASLTTTGGVSLWNHWKAGRKGIYTQQSDQAYISFGALPEIEWGEDQDQTYIVACNITEADQSQYLWSSRSDSGGAISILVNSSGSYSGMIGSSTKASGNSNIADGENHVLALVYDASEDRIYYYLDGVADGSAPTSGSTWLTTEDKRIGTREDSNSFGINGAVYCVPIYPRALSAWEIKQNTWIINELYQLNIDLYEPISKYELLKESGGDYLCGAGERLRVLK